MVGDITFDDLKIPMTVVAANLVTGEKREFTEGPLSLAEVYKKSRLIFV